MNRYPASIQQQGLWLQSRASDRTSLFNMLNCWRYKGSLNLKALRETLNHIIKVHSIYRTRFIYESEELYQVVSDDFNLDSYFEVIDLSEYSSDVRDKKLQIIEDELLATDFDYSVDQLIQFRLIMLQEDEYVLMFLRNHMVSDISSLNIFRNTLTEVYNLLVSSESTFSLNFNKKQYYQYAESQQSFIKSDSYQKKLSYWKEKLDWEVLSNSVFSNQSIKSLHETPKRAYKSCKLPISFGNKVKVFAFKNRVNQSSAYLFALNVLISRYFNTESIPVLTAFKNRKLDDLDFSDTIGLFANRVMVINTIETACSIKDSIKKTFKNLTEALQNGECIFEDLLRETKQLETFFNLSGISFNLFETQIESPELGGLESVNWNGNEIRRLNTPNFIDFSIRIEKDYLYINISMDESIAQSIDIVGMLDHYKTVLSFIINNPNQLVQDIEMISTTDRQQILFDFNDTAVAYSDDKTMAMLFEEQVVKTPDNIALAFENESITYYELNNSTNQLAHFVKSKGLKEQEKVLVFLDRSSNMIQAVMSILKAGGVYVPVDTKWPKERIINIIKTLNIRYIITQTSLLPVIHESLWNLNSTVELVLLNIDIENIPIEENVSDETEELWDFLIDNANDDISAGGFVSSYTGQHFTKAEVTQYQERIAGLLSPYISLENNILDLGCGSGTILFTLTGFPGTLTGIDPSAKSLNWCTNKITQNKIENINLLQGYAHDVDSLVDEKFNIILISSTIQFFPGLFYLSEVIEKCLKLLTNDGVLIISDVLNIRNKQEFRNSLLDFRANNSNKDYNTKLDLDGELYIDENFFNQVSGLVNTQVNILHRNGDFKNELRYRYDVIFEKGKPNNTEAVTINYSTKFHLKKLSTSNLNLSINPNNLAYIIHTSGSTGKPNGVAVAHKPVINLIEWVNKTFSITPEDRLLFTTSLCFDLSVYDIFGMLASGGSLRIASSQDLLNNEKLIDYLCFDGITFWDSAPAALQMLSQFFPNSEQTKTSKLRLVFLSGDWIPLTLPDAVRKSFVNAVVISLGGATEATVWSNYYPIGKVESSWASIPYGKPIQNAKYYILDSNLKVCPINIPGDLYIGGDCLAEGYINNKELTDDRFISNPFIDSETERIYKTGDIAKWLPDGNMEFLGRIDNQVKIRGYRIELGEIESQLLTHDRVKETIVLAREKDNDKYLVAYYMANDNIEESDLRSYVSGKLPSYMVPSYFMAMDSFPITPNGKIDRKAFPEPEVTVANDFVGPQNETEEKLTEIWGEILTLEKAKISVEKSFFELGGHSLLAVHMLSALNKELNVDVSLAALFDNSSIRTLGKYILGLEQENYTLIEPASNKLFYPVSTEQRRLYALQEFDRRNIAYNVPSMFMLHGTLDVTRLTEAFQKLIDRHESLRTNFEFINEELVQKVTNQLTFDLLKSSITEKEIQGKVKGFIRAFNLNKAPLLRAELCKISEKKHLLMIDMHHIITDGVSIAIFIQEFNSLYRGDKLEELRIHYKDYAVWEQSSIRGNEIEKQKQYWKEIFSDEIPVLELPLDYPRPKIRDFSGSRHTFDLPKETSSQLLNLCKEEDITLFNLLLSIYTVLLSKYSNQEDVVVGTINAGRDHEDIKKVMGVFINTLALRSQPSGSKRFTEYLQEVKEICIGAFDNQHYPFEELVEELGLERDMSHNPLFDTMFVLQNIDMEEMQLGNLKAERYNAKFENAKFDLTLTGFERNGQLSFNLAYATAIFDKLTIQRLAEHFKVLIDDIIANRNICIQDIQIILEEEKQKVLYEFNDTLIDYPKNKTLVDLFEDQVVSSPTSAAIIYKGQSIDYQTLNAKANQLAWYLKEKSVQREDIIALMVNRSNEMIIGLYGILKSGCAYLPIDPDYPQDRINYMLESSGAKIIITQNDINFDVTDLPIQVININDEAITRRSTNNLGRISLPESLAYLIYTSGSTGKPKGIMVEHRNVVNFITGVTHEIHFERERVLLSLTTISFDIFVLETFLALSKGVNVVIGSQEEQLDVQRMSDTIIEQNVELLQLTPSRLKMILGSPECDRIFDKIKILMVGGEALPMELLKDLRSVYHGRIYNMYGPTETTVWSTIKDLTNENNITIGKPIANTQIYILDRQSNPVPIGIEGELIIGGDGLARGYWKNETHTNEKYVANPFREGERMYKTGDSARWLPNGDIEFIGRIDNQVKIRGFRIELEEIESQLLSHDSVKEAIVFVKGKDNDKYLAAYFVSEENIEEDILRNYLSAQLPDYMVPSYFVKLEGIPLTPNGKVDRKALPEPEVQIGSDFTAPSSEIEQILAELWAGILKLNISEITTNRSFFELGGHSLRAVSMLAKLKKELNVEVSLADLFIHSDIKSLGNYINGLVKKQYIPITPIGQQPYYQVSSEQQRLYALQEFDVHNIAYNLPSVFLLHGEIDIAKLTHAFQQLIDRHEALRTYFEIEKDELVQKILDVLEFEILTSSINDEEIDNKVNEFIRPFNLNIAPLFRVELCSISSKKHLLMIDIHHIIADGVSMVMLREELNSLYRGDVLEDLRVQYKDYAAWEHSAIREEEINKQEQYWKGIFSDDIPILELPTDYPRPKVKDFSGSRHKFILSSNTTNQLKAICQKENITLFNLLLGTYSVLLSKYSNQDDIVVGTINAGRDHDDIKGVMGMFVNTLALRSQPKGGKFFTEFLQEIKEVSIGAFDNQHYPFEELVEGLGLERDMSHNPLFDTMFILQNMDKQAMQLGDLQMERYKMEFEISKFDISLTAFEHNDELHFNLEYAASLFNEQTIKRFASHYVNLIQNILSNIDNKISDIHIITDAEKEELLVKFDKTNISYPQEKTIIDFFSDQVAHAPSNIAVSCEGHSLSYLELDAQSSQLASLLKNNGIGKGSLVGLFTERSLETIIGLMAILKAGGAYVPIDVDYPKERIDYIVKDSGINVLLTSKNDKLNIQDDISVVYIEDYNQIPENFHYSSVAIEPSDLCYVIYTSGTTGNPKGVMVEHENVVRLLFNESFQFDFGSDDIWTMFHSHCFDFSVWEIFGALLYGGKLIIIPRMLAKDTKLFADILRDEKVTVLNQTPSAFYNLIQEDSSSTDADLNLRYVIFGGEALSPGKLKSWKAKYPKTKLINMFGITETTVHVTYKEIGEEEILTNISNIGRPIPTNSIYILNSDMQLVPEGVTGEMYVGGAGVSRGYLHKKQLTKDKFIPNPFNTGKRLYRTGDLARIVNSNEIEYLGRCDNQIQLRGFRIELGDIENHILTHNSIEHAIVLVKENEEEKYLIAYYVHKGDIDEAELRKYLSNKLPDYMVPSYFVPLANIPLTPNGKIDFKALPEAKMSYNDTYIPPNTTEEKIVSDIWSKVLGAENIGVTDDFFGLGGDSIKAIQICSRVRTAGYSITVGDIFEYRNIQAIVQNLQELNKIANQDLVTGEVLLSPIQRWFFDEENAHMHHYNQSMMLSFDVGITVETVREIFGKLQEHHDALRTVFVHQNGTVQQTAKASMAVYIEEHNFNSQQVIESNYAEICDKLQAGINLSEGPLVRLGLFHMSDHDRLLIVIHHLVIDMVSWRILFDDIETLYKQHLEGVSLSLPLKTDSFQFWCNNLLEYQNSNTYKNAIQYWAITEAKKGDLITPDYPRGCNKLKDRCSDFFTLDKSTTNKLLTKTHHPFGTEINEILLTALLLTAQKVMGLKQLRIDLEGHGREDIIDGIDISRTVGWFTSIYPVLLEYTGEDLGDILKNVKESLRTVPNKGFDYLLYKYLNSDLEDKGQYKSAQILFNYLGQLDTDTADKPFKLLAEPKGNDISGERIRNNDWEISGKVSDGMLSIALRYSKNQYNSNTIQSFLSGYKRSLTDLIKYCCSQPKVVLTPSDLTYKKLTIEELNTLQLKYEIEDIYTLSPMQEGMLFHSLYNEGSSMYFEQVSYKLFGTIDLPVMERSWNEVISRHAVLRTLFLHEGYQRPLQIVLQESKLDFKYQDIREECTKNTKDEVLQSNLEADRLNTFNLSKDALMRICVLQTDENEYTLVQSFHHILLDGWCIGILNAEYHKIYSHLRKGKAYTLPPVKTYAKYISWLEERDIKSATKYWDTYLSGYENLTTIQVNHNVIDDIPYVGESKLMKINEEKTQQLNKVSRTLGVTVNTILQSAWGILLNRYNNSNDCIFGSVVSGRPSEIDGIESMVGLFINTIPVRVKYNSTDSIDTLLKNIQSEAIKSEQYHYSPLAEIQSKHPLGRGLLDHILIFENYAQANNIEGLEAGASQFDLGYELKGRQFFEQTNYDLLLMISQFDQTQIKIDYNASKYSTNFINQVSNQLLNIIDSILRDPSQLISDIQIISDSEKQQLLFEFNNTQVEYPRNKTITDLFEEQVLKTPNNKALAYEGKSISYYELNQKANYVANIIKTKTDIPNQIIGLYFNSSIEMISALLGVLKSGNAFLPLSPHVSTDRNNFILDDSEVKLLLVQDKLNANEHIGGLQIDPQKIIEVKSDISIERETDNPKRLTGPNDIIYAIYTSGSTGKPKGVAVKHQGVVNYALWRISEHSLTENDVTLQLFSFHFDGYGCNFYPSLLSGGCLVLVDDENRLNAEYLINLIKELKVTNGLMTPAIYDTLLEAISSESDFDSLRFLELGGEEASSKLLEQSKSLVPGLTVANEYGPTEATIAATAYPKLDKNTVTIIGKPIANTRAYILGKNNEIQPIGVNGELCIAGDGIAKEYIKDERLTNQKFIRNPFNPKEKIYKTGDLACWLPDGNIKFMGRIDNQVKIRGFRIELGEIESQLLLHNNIKEAIVLAKEKDNVKYLAAYYVANLEIEEDVLRNYLANKLPDYMVPSYFTQLESFPLTPSGKIDRRALPEPQVKKGEDFMEPANELESDLIDIWADVLKIEKERISTNRSFFSIGGDSIKAMALISKIKVKYGVNISIKDFFENTDIKNIASVITFTKNLNTEVGTQNVKKIQL